MELNESIDQIKKQAEEFGMRLKDEARSKQNAVWRNNTKEISEYSHSYFGFIREGEASSQSYSDISLVFFPNYENPSQLLMSLAVGTEGFKNDYELALQPGLRRSFFKLLPLDNHISFCKRLFSDISNRADFVQDGFSIDKYLQYLLIGVVVNINDKSDWDIINGWLARYAQIRGWDSNKKIKNAVSKAIDKARVKEINNTEIEIERILTERKYVVIEGAPGVGKTHTASKIANKFDKIFFTQFHACTTYGDFVYGILPRLKSNEVIYDPHEGILLEAMKYASKEENKNKKVLLIIDEINRANLASVLGEVFYLFEPKREIGANYEIRIGNDSFKGMPSNLFVIGTMNTADRSLAVVDYALRRRFAWFYLKPVPFESLTDYGRNLYDRMAQIFENYASDSELNLQPGASYFIGSNDEEIKNRLRYELMPLIKEYLLNGLMSHAEQPLDDFFFEHINQRIFN